MTDEEVNIAVVRKLGYTDLRIEKSATACNELIAYRGAASQRVPNYCRSIAAAWEAVDSQKTLEFYISNVGHRRIWRCKVISYGMDLVADVEAATAPMAICLAFLKLP